MNAELYSLVQKHLIANLDPEAGLFDVIIESLPDELTEAQIEECKAYLLAMLAVMRSFANGLRPMSGDSSN